MLSELALTGLVVIGINLLPVAGPPTWAALVVVHLRWDVPAVPLILVGAVCAALGRYLLAWATRAVARWLPAARVQRLQDAGLVMTRKRSGTAALLGLFVLSPIPSAQMFEAAGVMRLRLVPLTLAFFAGRVIAYSVYVGTASAARRGLGEEVVDKIVSWPVLAWQGFLLLLLWAASRVDWRRRFGRNNRST